MRIEPPPSLPWATGTMPGGDRRGGAAGGAARRALEVPGVARRAEEARLADVGRMPYSGSVVVPTITKPASLQPPRDVVVVLGARCSAISEQPYVSRRPSTGRLFLIAIGTPANGRASPGPIVVGGRERALGVDLDERVERRVELLDPLQRRLAPARARRPRRSAPSLPARSRHGTSDRCRSRLLLCSSGTALRRPRRRADAALEPTRPGIPATICACPQGSHPVKHQAQKASAMSAVTVTSGGPVGPRRRRRLRHRDRRARQRGRRAALPRRRHRGPRRRGPLRAGLGPAGRRPLQTRPAARRTARADRALGRPRAWTCSRRWRCSRRSGASAQLIDITDEEARDNLARASVMALSFVAQSARGRRPAAGAAAEHRRGPHDPRALPDPLARRGQPGPREGDRRLLDLGRRARHERLHVHRARGRLDRRRRGGGAVGARWARCRVRCTAARPRAC